MPFGETSRNGGTGFPLAELSVDPIQRVQVIQGIPSVLYGSNAHGGVIYVVTRQAAGDLPTLRLLTSYGPGSTHHHRLLVHLDCSEGPASRTPPRPRWTKGELPFEGEGPIWGSCQGLGRNV